MPDNMTFIKGTSDWWFMGVYSNNYLDRESEIISKAAHEEYAQWLTDTGVKPPITLMHLPMIPSKYLYAGLTALIGGKMSVDQYNDYLLTIYKDYAIAQAEVVFTIKGFNFVVGKVFPHKVDTVKKMVDSGIKWRMSHGFAPLKKEDNIISKYIGFEFTSLPDFMAANEVTLSMFGEIMEKELTDEQREALLGILGVDPEESAEEATTRAQAALEGIIPSKAVDVETIAQSVYDQFDMKGLEQAFKQVIERLITVEERLAALEVDEEEAMDKAIADQYRPQWPVAEEVGVEDEELATELKEKGHAGDQPVNMMQVGFFDALMGAFNG